MAQVWTLVNMSAPLCLNSISDVSVTFQFENMWLHLIGYQAKYWNISMNMVEQECKLLA